MVRTAGDPAAVAKSVQAAIGEVTTRTVVEYANRMDRVVAEAVAPWRFSMALLVGLAALGAVLAATGLFALIAYAVDQRSHELAVRLAIGAGPGAVLRMVLWQGGRFALAGLVVGVGCSLAVANGMSSLLFNVPARDGFTFGAAVGLLGATAFLAGYLAARRVIKIDPLLAMRVQ
jgi:ABC-type antimicrobial peptide transport system permease subunit